MSVAELGMYNGGSSHGGHFFFVFLKGVMPDGTSRFHDQDGNEIFHFMGCSTMSEYTVIAEISCAKISKEMSLEKAALFGCGVATGLGK